MVEPVSGAAEFTVADPDYSSPPEKHKRFNKKKTPNKRFKYKTTKYKE